HTGQGQGSGRLGDGAGVFEHILDGGADFVSGDGNDFIDGVFADIPGFFADLFDRDTVGKDAHFVQNYSLASGHGGLTTVRVFRFDADHFDFRAQIFDVRSEERRVGKGCSSRRVSVRNVTNEST